MAAPTTTTPSPPPSEPSAAAAAAAEPKAPSPPAEPDAPPAPEPEAKQKKRKLEEMGFQDSAYYKIRAIVADLRPHFLLVYQASDFRNNDAAREILKEIQVIMELSKKMRLDLSAADEPVKPSDKPSAGAVKDEPTETIPSGEKYEAPHTAQAASSSSNAVGSALPNPDNSESAAEKLPEETQPGTKSSEIKDCPKQLDEGGQGSYVIGGSPIGWNFLVWPGSKVVYYGLTKAEWSARQAAK